jgi:histidine triad (HIT) family protein
MTQCVFCDILQQKRDAEILYENAEAVAILDINPIHHGHSLVIPRRHCRDFLELSPEAFHGIMEAAQVVARAMVKGLKLEGFNIFSNNGRIAGQSVYHFHLHVTPRYADDNIRFVLELKSYENGKMAEMGALIRNHIPKP